MIHCSFFYLVISVLAFSVDREGHVAGTQIPRIRGIPISKNSLYNPDRDFECLDGSRIIRFERVNDDYCDCGDGSDEPGTAACSNGVFFCQNTGHQAKYIASSRVNDGVCDCCDASDEYASGKECLDNCHDLGKEARMEAEKAAELAKEGNKIRMEMLTLGKRLKSEHQAKLIKLRSDYEEAGLTKKEKEVLKNQAEERESAALEKYKPAEPEKTHTDADEEEEIRRSEAEEYFKMLDSDKSGTVSIIELQTRVTFDRDGNGEVSEEEALFFLNNKPELNYEDFVDYAWATMKPFVMREQGAFKPPSHTGEKETTEEDEESLDGASHDDLDGEEEAHEEAQEEEHEKEPEEPEVHYDEETQALIDEATQARERFQEAEKSLHELQTEIRRLEERIERDYGPEEEFSSLDGECFEHRDLEYVYSLCPFGRASQRSVSGGAEVNLGSWHEWVGPENNKYSKMKYDRGLTCWNGPARNTIVNLRCGKENRLISVSEPSRCEYTMVFTTPALCNPNLDTSDVHDEL